MLVSCPLTTHSPRTAPSDALPVPLILLLLSVLIIYRHLHCVVMRIIIYIF